MEKPPMKRSVVGRDGDDDDDDDVRHKESTKRPDQSRSPDNYKAVYAVDCLSPILPGKRGVGYRQKLQKGLPWR